MHYALFSGGHDSLVSTHYCMENDLTDKVLHLDTRTGIPETQMFVENVCEDYGWDLRVQEAPHSFREVVLEYGDEPYGFPGPGMHIWAYSLLKERSLREVAKGYEDKPHYYTGVRKAESDRRMTTVSEGTEETPRWIWHAPIAEWSDEDAMDYMEEHDLPKNPVVQNMHMSGECLCGAFSNRDEELIDLQANYPKKYEEIMDIEEEAREVLGKNNPRAYWAHGRINDSDLKSLMNEYEPKEQVLCSDCRASLHEEATDW